VAASQAGSWGANPSPAQAALGRSRLLLSLEPAWRERLLPTTSLSLTPASRYSRVLQYCVVQCRTLQNSTVLYCTVRHRFFVPVRHCEQGGRALVQYLCIVPRRHSVTMSQCHCITLSQCYNVTVSLYFCR